jgi:hypothetical protein
MLYLVMSIINSIRIRYMALFNIELRRVMPHSEYLTGIYEVYRTVLDGYQTLTLTLIRPS